MAEGDVLVSAGVGPYGEVAAVWSTAEGRDALLARVNGGTSPVTRPAAPVPVRLTRHSPALDLVVKVDALTLAHPHVQPLPYDRFLLVGGRCRWRPEGAERNAQVVDANGSVVHKAVLGDGIQDVATTPSGQAWVGYFDEGVVGNFGWGFGPGPEPVGATGLVRFDESLRRVWDFQPGDGLGSIADCYALNVDDEDAWTCYYDDFPIVRVAGDRVTGWSNKSTGAYALVVDGRRCALIGGYHKRGRFVAGDLTDDGRFVVRRQDQLSGLPGRGRLRAIAGRGDTLHVLAGTTHYQVDLASLLPGRG